MNNVWTVLIVALALWLPTLEGAAAHAEVPFDPGATIKAVAARLESQHIFKKSLDDELSRFWLRSFLEALDPRRMYFLTSDIDEYSHFNSRLDDLAKTGDFQFAQLVRAKYRQRVKEAAAFAEEFITTPHDKSLIEESPPQL